MNSCAGGLMDKVSPGLVPGRALLRLKKKYSVPRCLVSSIMKVDRGSKGDVPWNHQQGLVTLLVISRHIVFTPSDLPPSSITCSFHYLQFQLPAVSLSALPLPAVSITCSFHYLQFPLPAVSVTCSFHCLQFSGSQLCVYQSDLAMFGVKLHTDTIKVKKKSHQFENKTNNNELMPIPKTGETLKKPNY